MQTAGDQRGPSKDWVLRPREHLSGASWEHSFLQKRNRYWSRKLRNSCHFPGAVPPQPPSSSFLTEGLLCPPPPPPPQAQQLLVTSSFFTASQSHPGPDTPCLGSGLEPVRNQSASFTQVWILLRGCLRTKEQVPRWGALLSDSLEGLQANLLPSFPYSLWASNWQPSGPGSLPPYLFLVQLSWAPPPQLSPTHPQAPLLKAVSLSDGVSGSPWGHRLRQNCCCSRSTGLASALPTVSAVGLLPCLLWPKPLPVRTGLWSWVCKGLPAPSSWDESPEMRSRAYKITTFLLDKFNMQYCVDLNCIAFYFDTFIDYNAVAF